MPRYVLLFFALGVAGLGQSYDEDFTLPLDDGSILIHAQIILSKYGSSIPELDLKLKNQTSSSWGTLKLQFDIGALCAGYSPHQWTVTVDTGVGKVERHEGFTLPMLAEATSKGCRIEIMKASLVLAESSIRPDKGLLTTRINGVTEPVDLDKQLQEIKAKRETEAAAKAEEERKAADAQAKQDAAETARRRRLAAEQKKKDAELNARLVKERAEDEAKATEERRKVRAACTAVYRDTADKKLGDLTVKEEQQVRACQALGLYPPQ